jgi:lipopolysaccharide transport system permease protein
MAKKSDYSEKFIRGFMKQDSTDLISFVVNATRLSIFEVQKRSLNTYVGWIWSGINPLAQIALMYFIMTYVFKSTMPNILLWLVSGLAVWITIQTTISRSCSSLVSRRALMQNNNISPSLLVTADMLSELFILAPLYLIGVLVSFAHGTQSLSLLLIPVIMLTLVIFLFGICLTLATITPWLRDLPYLIGLGMQVAFWFTPIAYARASMTGPIKLIVQLNPFTYFIEWSQAIFLGKTIVTQQILIPVSLALTSLAIGKYVAAKLTKKMVIHL